MAGGSCRVGRGCPCHLAGRSLRASCPALTPCKLRFGILPALACKAGEMTRATPPSRPVPLAPSTPHRINDAAKPGFDQPVSHVTVPQLAQGASMRHTVYRTELRSSLRSLASLIKAPGASPGTAGTNATPPPTPHPRMKRRQGSPRAVSKALGHRSRQATHIHENPGRTREPFGEFGHRTGQSAYTSRPGSGVTLGFLSRRSGHSWAFHWFVAAGPQG